MLNAADLNHVHIAQRLATAPIGWLATTRRDGRPQSVPVWFAWLQTTVVVFSARSSAKLIHLRHRPNCSFGLETADGGNDVVLIDATARVLDDGAAVVEAAEQVFRTKYGLGDRVDEWRSQFAIPIELRPERVVAWSKPGGELRYTVIQDDGPRRK